MTRPLDASERFWAQVPDRFRSRYRKIISPLIEIVSLPVSPPGGFRGTIVTSSNAVSAVARDGLAKLPCFCVGRATAAAAQASGIPALYVGETADALVHGLIDLAPDTPLVHVRGTHTRGDVSGRLTPAGLWTEDLIVYDQKLHPLTEPAVAALTVLGTVAAPLLSPRTATQFAHEIQRLGTMRAQVIVSCLSPTVAAPLAAISALEIRISDRPTVESLIEVMQS